MRTACSRILVPLVIHSVLATLAAPALAALTAPGWRWYNEPPPVAAPQPDPEVEEKPSVTVTRTLTPTQQMDWFHRFHQDVTNDAVLNPTDLEKVERAMALNQFVAEQSGAYGMTMKKALLDDPSLSYTRSHPTEQAARKTYLAGLRQQKTAAVRTLAQQGYGLFFVYRGEDPIAGQLAPSIQDFADRYGIDLLGITLDQSQNGAIRNNRPNQGRLVVEHDPALVLVNPKTGDMKPLAYGFIAQDALLGRFLNAATNFTPDF